MNGVTTVFSNRPGFISTGAVTAEEIRRAENALSLAFAEDYRTYLERYGCVSFVGHELTGICSSAGLNVVDATVRNRDLLAGLPADWYVVEETHIDGIVIWQNTGGTLFRTQPGTEPVRIAQGLSAYLNG